MSSELNQMSAIPVAQSGERSPGRGRYGVVCRGNPVWSIPERLELKFHERRYTSTLYLLPTLSLFTTAEQSLLIKDNPLLSERKTHIGSTVTNLLTAGGRFFAVNGSTIWELQTDKYKYMSVISILHVCYSRIFKICKHCTIKYCTIYLAVWLSCNVLVSINVVALHLTPLM